jgi:polysaccharide export outer membrane protein
MHRAVGRSIAAAWLAICCAGCGGAPVQTGGAQPADEVRTEYLIGPGDMLQVFVFNHPELSVTVPVRPDGYVSTPLVEDIAAVGKTPTALARDVESMLAEYVRSPTVNIIVTAFQGEYQQQVRVVGQAANPQALSYRNGMTLLDVMIAVGGLTEFASGNRAKLIRQTTTGPVELSVKLRDLLNDGDIDANMPVQPGDVIVVPESIF